MFKLISKRLILMVPILAVISIISFLIIQLPPGDFLTTYVAGWNRVILMYHRS